MSVKDHSTTQLTISATLNSKGRVDIEDWEGDHRPKGKGKGKAIEKGRVSTFEKVTHALKEIMSDVTSMAR